MFSYQQNVKVISGFYSGYKGVVEEHDTKHNTYKIKLISSNTKINNKIIQVLEEEIKSTFMFKFL